MAASTGGLFTTKHGFGGVVSLAGEPAPQPPPPDTFTGDSFVFPPHPLLFEEDLLSASLPQPSCSSGGFTTESQPLFDAPKIDKSVFDDFLKLTSIVGSSPART